MSVEPLTYQPRETSWSPTTSAPLASMALAVPSRSLQPSHVEAEVQVVGHHPHRPGRPGAASRRRARSTQSRSRGSSSATPVPSRHQDSRRSAPLVVGRRPTPCAPVCRAWPGPRPAPAGSRPGPAAGRCRPAGPCRRRRSRRGPAARAAPCRPSRRPRCPGRPRPAGRAPPRLGSPADDDHQQDGRGRLAEDPGGERGPSPRATATASPPMAVTTAGQRASGRARPPSRRPGRPRLPTMTSRNAASWERPPSTACQPRFCQTRACRNSAGPTPASGSTAHSRPPGPVPGPLRARAASNGGQRPDGGEGQRHGQGDRPAVDRPGVVPAAAQAGQGRVDGQPEPAGPARAPGRPWPARAGHEPTEQHHPDRGQQPAGGRVGDQLEDQPDAGRPRPR